jgi:hypothetical protein
MGANPIGSEDLKSLYSGDKFNHHKFLDSIWFSSPITAFISEVDIAIMLVVAARVESEKVSGYGGPDDMTLFAKFHKNLGVWLACY